MIRERLRGGLEDWLLRVWFGPASFLDRLLATLASPVAVPLSWLVAAIARRRRRRIRRQAAGSGQVPVVVVGNLVAGGSGKTPLVAAIAAGLLELGFHPALLAGGYRSRAATRNEGMSGDGVLIARPDSDPAQVGDEAVLLAAASGLPVAVARDREAAAACLLREYTDCDVIISDDGLQHVGLARRLELLVVDERGFGNRRCLPAGPLREPADRSDSVDAIILTSGTATEPSGSARRFRSTVQLKRFRALDGDAQWKPEAFARQFAAQPLSAIAGISRPQRFFAVLQGLGLQPLCHALPDHARIDPAWLAALPGRWLLMTGKDAVKCRNFDRELRARCVWLEVAAVPDPALLKWLAAELRPAAQCNG